jgi:hypothetical protein
VEFNKFFNNELGYENYNVISAILNEGGAGSSVVD